LFAPPNETIVRLDESRREDIL
jgi:hypothetical protein